jgi:hypothetical protein
MKIKTGWLFSTPMIVLSMLIAGESAGKTAGKTVYGDDEDGMWDGHGVVTEANGP